jgi:hypothetical protein
VKPAQQELWAGSHSSISLLLAISKKRQSLPNTFPQSITMVQVLRIAAVLALLAVSTTAELATKSQVASRGIDLEPSRMLASATGSGSGSATIGDASAANAAIIAQYTAAKTLLESVFADQESLLTKLKEFETTVETILKTTVITSEQAFAQLREFLVSLQSDPAFASVKDKLAPIEAVIGPISSGSSKSGSGSDAAIGGSKANAASGSSASSTVTTPAPTTSSASSIATVVAPVTAALVAVYASF